MGMSVFETDLVSLAMAIGIAVLAGLVKGLVGFALPMIFISGLSLVLPPQLAIGALIIPTLFTNGFQALRQGRAVALASIKRFRYYLVTGCLCLFLSAQFVLWLEPQMLFLLLGIPVTGFTLWQLIKADTTLIRQNPTKDALVGGVAGLLGGISGIWGPPTVLYLTAIGTQKATQIQVQGVIYGLGAVALTIAHIGSGVLQTDSLSLSITLVAPALAGLWLGDRLQYRVDQNRFRRLTLLILLISGFNLLRRGLF